VAPDQQGGEVIDRNRPWGLGRLVGWSAVVLFSSACEIQADSAPPTYAPPPPTLPGGAQPSPARPGVAAAPASRTLPAHIAHVPGLSGEEVVVPSYAPGSAVVFAQPDAQLPARIFVKRHIPQGSPPAPNEVIWQVSAQQSQMPNRNRHFGSATVLQGVGFEVPQLPRGVYDAWYFDGRPTMPVRPTAAPVKPADPRASQSITFEIKPRLRLPEAVVIGAAGTDVDVVVGFYGPPAVPPTTAAPGWSFERLPVSLAGLGAFAQLAPGQAPQTITGPDGLAHFRLRLMAPGQVDLRAAAPGFDPAMVRLLSYDASTGARPLLRTDLLQPGDVFLYYRNGIISDAIVGFEGDELGNNPNGRPTYSHAGIYLGKNDQGVDEVIEMLEGGWNGWTRRPVEQSAKDETILLDVYRRPWLTPAQRQQVRNNAINYHAEHNIFGHLDHLPYANGQIIVLLKAYTAVLDTPVRMLADYEDIFDEGKDRMICSELVAWSYYDAGLQLRVRAWPDVQKHGLLSTLNRWMDYTTPNMLAQSPDRCRFRRPLRRLTHEDGHAVTASASITCCRSPSGGAMRLWSLLPADPVVNCRRATGCRSASCSSPEEPRWWAAGRSLRSAAPFEREVCFRLTPRPELVRPGRFLAL
jgi:hypothetical protein